MGFCPCSSLSVLTISIEVVDLGKARNPGFRTEYTFTFTNKQMKHAHKHSNNPADRQTASVLTVAYMFFEKANCFLSSLL